jgi:hypothetical protein
MAQQILQVNFTYSLSREEYENTVAPMGQTFADVPRCLWKIWLLNEENSEGGGIYLFADEASVAQYIASDLWKGVLSHPALSDFSIRQFGVIESVSRTTRAPLPQAAAA